jgi:glucose/arabinose dehydrogenase
MVAAACGKGDEASFDQRAARTTTTSAANATSTEVPTTVAGATATGPPVTKRPGTTARPGTTRAPGTAAPASPTNVRLTQIAALSQPLDLASRTGDPASLYVAEKGGRVRAIRNGAVDPTAVLDVSGEVSTGGEQGLLGLTFSPDGSHLYVNITDRAGDTRILEFAMAGGQANAGSRRQLLLVDQPYANHNGGGLQFGPDGRLYIGLGDGGSGNDPQGNGQNLNTPLGKLLRMNVADGSYDLRAYGLRNPFRFSFDRSNGDIWIGDVGQDAWEEVDRAPAGSGRLNFGWGRMEGNHPVGSNTAPPNHTPPVHEYSHSTGACVVTGGYVYRGSRMPGNNGMYVFIDVCIGDLWALQNGARRSLGPKAQQIVSFGQDLSGELYALSLNGPVYRIDPA